VCDLKSSKVRGPGPDLGCCATKKKERKKERKKIKIFTVLYQLNFHLSAFIRKTKTRKENLTAFLLL
jgi:hypothetical protein